MPEITAQGAQMETDKIIDAIVERKLLSQGVSKEDNTDELYRQAMKEVLEQMFYNEVF